MQKRQIDRDEIYYLVFNDCTFIYDPEKEKYFVPYEVWFPEDKERISLAHGMCILFYALEPDYFMNHENVWYISTDFMKKSFISSFKDEELEKHLKTISRLEEKILTSITSGSGRELNF